MKTADEIIRSYGKPPKSGGEEVVTLGIAIKAINAAREDAIRECAEIAQAYIGVNDEPIVAKGSILSLIKELK